MDMVRTLVIAGLALVAATPARGATVHVQPTTNEPGGDSQTVTFIADPGEKNDVFAVRSGTAWVIRDNGAPLTAGAGCTAIDANSATCRPTHATNLFVSAGDGADSVRTPLDDLSTIV